MHAAAAENNAFFRYLGRETFSELRPVIVFVSSLLLLAGEWSVNTRIMTSLLLNGPVDKLIIMEL